MGLGGEVEHGGGLVGRDHAADLGGIADVHALQRVAAVALRLRDGIEIARVSELVDVDDERIGLVEQMAHHRRADEARAAGDKDGLARKLLSEKLMS